ncbi:unnamed protein product [Urochloa humidicola]
MRSLPNLWKEWEIQLTVLLSFGLQVFLLITGCMLRRNNKGLLRVLIWLAYVGADAVAVFGLGLISHYGEKECMLRSRSFGDAQPFLWTPFLLVHLGGQDSITAYSIEDNNLWLRHLLNLGIQGALALYILWKSLQVFNSQVLIPAALTFISGTIKYGERIWALRNGSREGLGKTSEPEQSLGQNNYTQLDNHPENMNIYSYALRTVLHTRGLFIGRTMLQLGDGIHSTQLVNNFFEYEEAGTKLKIILMELGMMFDLLYTKAVVLQRWVGCMFRFASQMFMVIAFMIFHNRANVALGSILFLKMEKDVHSIHDQVNIGITYTLFVGAIVMETFSVATVVASPWTRVHLREGSFLHWLFISNACFNFMAIQCNKMMPSSNYSIGQYNHIDFISSLPKSRVLCSVISALGLGEQWRKLCYVKRIEAQGIVEYIERRFDRLVNVEEHFRQPLYSQRRLNFTLCLPFEHALYRLHIFTDLHICKYLDERRRYSDDVMQLKEDCEKLSNYMMYLWLVQPSMLPVSVVVRDGKLSPREAQLQTRIMLLEQHADFGPQPDAACPFYPVQKEPDLRASLEDIKEIWTRLLVYAAGKCGGELHARQLGEGGELLSSVWLLMLHHGIGDAAREVKLLRSDNHNLPEPGSLVSAAGNNWTQSEEPVYTFDFRQPNAMVEQIETSIYSINLCLRRR